MRVLVFCGVAVVVLCSPAVVQGQDAPKGFRRISKLMRRIPSLNPMSSLSVTGMSGLGGFFGMSPVTTGLISLMSYQRPQESAPPPNYSPPISKAQSHPSAPPPHPPPVSSHSVPPPPRSSYGAPPHYPHGHVSQIPHPHYLPSQHQYPALQYSQPHQGPSRYLPPPHYGTSSNQIHHPYASVGRPHIHSSPYLASPYTNQQIPHGGFYKGSTAYRSTSHPGYLKQSHVGAVHSGSVGIPIAIPRHMLNGPIGGPIAMKTSEGMLIGPFERPVHYHGMPTVSQVPLSMGEVAPMTMQDYITSAFGPTFGLHQNSAEGSFVMPTGIDILSDSYKSLGMSDFSHMMNFDDLKNFDIRENLLASATTLKNEQRSYEEPSATVELRSIHPPRTLKQPELADQTVSLKFKEF